MPEVPKIVHHRLRAGLPASSVPGVHPDPDVLTAFAEQSLGAAERESVLQHLAKCGDCRELVALSVPPMESGSQPVAPEESGAVVSADRNARAETGGVRSWFTWPGLRWAALAAGVAVAGGILLIHPGKPAAVPEAKQQPASTSPRPEETIAAKQAAQDLDSAVNTAKLEKKAAPATRAFARDKELQFADSAAATADKVIARGQIERRAANKDLGTGITSGAAMSAAPLATPPAPQVPSVSQTVEVTAASGPVATEEARSDISLAAKPSFDLPVSGKQVSDLTISKTKAAAAGSNEPSRQPRSESVEAKPGAAAETTGQRQRAVTGMNKLTANLRQNTEKSAFPQPAQYAAQWGIHGNDLQRSLDSGVTWTTVLHSERPWLCYAADGNDIWVGGKAGDLFHSANGGGTWIQLHPTDREQVLSGDVTHIDFYSPSQIVLFTSDNQSWSTADGGKTWEKK